VSPSADGATLVPNWSLPKSSVCWAQVEPERVNTDTVPLPLRL
jgi:hypothetical protein